MNSISMARGLVALFVLSALFGAIFAGVSTYDFVQHLDRQVHGAHCSFIPGLGAEDSGSSGCDVALMSPYSSVFRTWVWGGLPVALPGLALFVWMTARGAALSFADIGELRGQAFVMVLWSFVASITSVVMGSIAYFQLEAMCKSCIGIYATSFVCLITSALIVASALDAEAPKYQFNDADAGPLSKVPPIVGHLAWLAAGAVFVLAPCLLYMLLVPDFTTYIGKCGGLEEREDRYGVLIPLHPVAGGVETIEVFDPLCPACKSMEDRLSRTGQTERLDRKLVLFPLDDTCNWMIGEAIHPGACMTSEAVLCADDPTKVIDWAFDHQEEIMEVAREGGDKAVKAHILEAQPQLKGCLGSAKARQRLNRSLRWSVNNSLKVLTPQLFIDGVAVCEEDTDLGFTYTMSEMIDRAEKKTLTLVEAE